MRITEIQFHNFGKFSDKHFAFQDGLNILYGANEMGKTTIHSFIRGMLFGIEKFRGRAAKNDEYSMREPWKNSANFAGVLKFESGGKIFRIERTFQKANKSLHLICETDGEELDPDRGDLEVLLNGLSEVAFRNTFYIRQNSSATDEGLAVELKNYMANLQQSGDEEINVDAALSALHEKRKELEGKKKLEEAKEIKCLRELEMKEAYVQQEIEELQLKQQEWISKPKGLDVQILEGEPKVFAESRKPIWKGIVFLGAVIALALSFLMSATLGKLICGLICLVMILILWLGYLKEVQEQKRRAVILEAQAVRMRQADAIRQEQEMLRWRQEQLGEELREKQVILANLRESKEEILEEYRETERLESEIEALLLARETIIQISGDIYRESARKLNDSASGILAEITGGRYTSIFLDENMQVRINTPQKLLFLEQVSRGTMDQIYFALRMAAGELLCGEEPMPIVLDDAFVMYDEERLERTIAWLLKCGRQVLLFTCHHREKEIMDRLLMETKKGFVEW